MADQLKEMFCALIWPEKSQIKPVEFLAFITCVILICVGFVFGMLPVPESLLTVIVMIASSVIGLGTFMTRFSHHYLKSISLRGFGFLVFATLSYFAVQSESFPTENITVNWLFMIACLVLALILIFYAILDLIFAISFSMTTKTIVCWNKSNGKLHVNSRHIYFRSNNGKKRFAINSNDVIDVEYDDGESDSPYVEIYFLRDLKINSEKFYVSDSERICKNIRKLFGL